MKKIRAWKRLKKKTGIVVEGGQRIGRAQAKGAATPRRIRDPRLGKARHLVQNGKTAAGLAVLDAAAAADPSAAQKLKIAAIVADADFKKGDFAKAATGYAKAGRHAGQHPRVWLRAALGQVRAQLKDANVAAAGKTAAEAWAKAPAMHEESERKLALDHARAAGQKLRIGKRPHRASVVASRLGLLFWLEGETALAKEYFTKALEVNPQGASRARQGLAAIALAEGHPAEAENRARESLLLGKLQRKTIATWPLLIAARQRQGLRGIDADFLAALRQNPEPTVRARAILTIAKTLRDHGDPAWQSIAAEWLAGEGAKYPIEATELQKLQLASERREGRDALGQRERAAALLQKPHRLSLSEFIAVAKEQVRASFWANKAPKLVDLMAQAETTFGKGASARVGHSLARACMLGKRHDLARPLLNGVMASSIPGSKSWQMAAYALARAWRPFLAIWPPRRPRWKSS